jgi:hypothetical protein
VVRRPESLPQATNGGSWQSYLRRPLPGGLQPGVQCVLYLLTNGRRPHGSRVQGLRDVNSMGSSFVLR